MAGKDEQFIIGRFLREAREDIGYIRDQVSERVGIGTRYLIAIENEEKKPKLDTFFRIIRALGISADPLVNQERYADIDEANRLVNLIYTCTPQERRVIAAMIDAMIDNRDKEESK